MIYGFDKETAAELVEAARTSLANPLGQDRPRTGTNIIGATSPHNVIIKVTSTTTTQGLYPCRWCVSDPAVSGTPPITFTAEGEVGWAYGLNDAVLELKDYIGQFRGLRPADKLAIFVASPGGGGGGGSFNLTVQESDGTPIVLNVNKIIFTSTNLKVTAGGPGEAIIDTVGYNGSVVTNVVCNGDGTITLTLHTVVNGVVK